MVRLRRPNPVRCLPRWIPRAWTNLLTKLLTATMDVLLAPASEEIMALAADIKNSKPV